MARRGAVLPGKPHWLICRAPRSALVIAARACPARRSRGRRAETFRNLDATLIVV
jgi:hypothetical protein